MAKCILIVDDSETVRQVLQLALGNAGYQVVEAEDGFDALAKLSGAQIDMLITDLNMPNMDGLELIEKVREEGNHRFTPIVMLTTESSEEKKSGKGGKDKVQTQLQVKHTVSDELILFKMWTSFPNITDKTAQMFTQKYKLKDLILGIPTKKGNHGNEISQWCHDWSKASREHPKKC